MLTAADGTELDRFVYERNNRIFPQNFITMDKYTFEMVPGLIGEITELLRSIDSKLDGLPSASEQVDTFPEWMSIKDLTAYMPTHPAAPTIYGWVRENIIPYYKQGKGLFFKKSEIEKWMADTRRKTQDEIYEEALQYCEKKPLGVRKRRLL